MNPDLSTTGTAATGTVSGNIITKYQKGGIVVNGPGAAVTISDNTVTGEGRVAYTAQNGIQVSRGATGTITRNTVTSNAYTGANNASSSGILLIGGYVYGPITTGVSVTDNTLVNNDMGVYVYNADASGSKPPTTKTKNSVVNNTISNDGRTNISGNGSGFGYQVGIYDFGNKDNIVNNKISGTGYTPITGSVILRQARPHRQHEAARQQQRLDSPRKTTDAQRGPLRRASLCESPTTTAGPRISHTSVMATGLKVGGDVEQALDSVGVPSYVLDTTGVVRWINPAAERLVGDVRGRQFTSVVAPEDSRRAREQFSRKVLGGSPATDATAVLVSTAGTRVPVEISSVPLMSGERVVGVFGLFEEHPDDMHHSATPASHSPSGRGTPPSGARPLDEADRRRAPPEHRDGQKPHPPSVSGPRRQLPTRSRRRRPGRIALLSRSPTGGRQRRCSSWSAMSRKVASQETLATPQSRPSRTTTASASGATYTY